jgi:serine/threonine-protein kinase
MTSSSRASIRVGSYQLGERIGEGAYAHVHRAVGADGQPVAVKLLAPEAELADEAARARFAREVATLAELRHPGIIPLVDHGIDDELGPWLATPLITGRSLRELAAGGRLCPEAALLLLEAVAGAVAAMHAAGLMHRDLKPENALIAPDGRVVLVDLGLAYRAGQTRYTDEGAVVGSVPYMAPEQIEGGAVAPAADVWALGVMTYEWITGARPFARERPAEEAAAALVGAFAPLRAADRRAGDALSELVAGCLARDAQARPSAAAVHERAAALIDWARADGWTEERAALAADAAGFQARVAGFRVMRVKREAGEAIDRGDSFGALRVIDRGLAYAPDDAELKELAERAEAGGVKAKPQPPRKRRTWLIGGAVVLAIAAAGVGVWKLSGDEQPQPVTPAPQTATDQEARDALDLFGGMINLMDRGMKLEEQKEARKRAAALDAGVAD